MLLLLISCTKTQAPNCCPEEVGAVTPPAETEVEASEDISSSEETAVEEDPEVAYVDVGFVECSQCIEDNRAERRYGIAVTDVNQDGDFEAVVTGYGHANQVWDWRDEKLVDIAPESLQDSDRKAIGVAACDVDKDGQEEIYFLNVDQFGGLGEVTDRLYDETADGWIDLFEQPVNAEQVNRFSGRSVACIDRLATGHYGIFVANYGGPMKLFEVDTKRFTKQAPACS